MVAIRDIIDTNGFRYFVEHQCDCRLLLRPDMYDLYNSRHLLNWPEDSSEWLPESVKIDIQRIKRFMQEFKDAEEMRSLNTFFVPMILHPNTKNPNMGHDGFCYIANQPPVCPYCHKQNGVRIVYDGDDLLCLKIKKVG
jgi:hypothetical protein